MAAPTARFKLGIDIGGTFTDLTLIDVQTRALHMHKVPSTPAEPSRAVARGVSELMGRLERTPAEIDSFVHGTTIALNALLEYRGARVGLVVSAGTGDILEIGRLTKHDNFNLLAAAPRELVPRRQVIEAGGRVDPTGRRTEALDPAPLERGLQAARAHEPESFAVCLLHAYADASDETAVRALVERVLPGRHVSLSSELWPEIREYERAMVAVLNAYVQPTMSRYVQALQRHTAEIGMRSKLYITQSNGGIMSALTAQEKPVRTLLSGPASGVVGAAYIARLCGIQEAVTIDIGGTSADVSLIRQGRPVHSTEARVGAYPVVMPSVDVFAVGAGGGSIAWFDPVGLLKVGPRSAGAMPGPAAYGNGNTEPTVTDAYIVCGFIDPERFLGGAMRLDRKLAEEAVGMVAQRLGLGLQAAAEAILKIATSNMTTALLPMMTKRGVDPRDFALIPFGGAGATHACLLAEEVIIPRIVVPPHPGTTCALGAAIADVQNDYIRSMRSELSKIDPAAIRTGFAQLEAEGRAWLAAESPQTDAVQVHFSVDARYHGQAFDIEVELPADAQRLDAAFVAERFHATYEQLYRNCDRNARIDLVNLRVRVVGKSPALHVKPLPPGTGSPEPTGERDIWWGGRSHRARIYARSQLRAGDRIFGPAVVEQVDTTTVVAPGYAASTDAHGVLSLERTPEDA